MSNKKETRKITDRLADPYVNVKIKISALWASVVFCYIYGDFFGLFRTGKIERIIDGYGPFGTVTQGSLLSVAIITSIPCVMVALSLMLKPNISRWLNIIVATIFIIFLGATMLISSWYFYFYLGFIEILLKLMIIWLAWQWPLEDHKDT
ncbi:DUF6326 family protein [Microbulbifer sp. THAF38]|uniref:DUF6326 family protein n=1 Tax=Microbulbifer sp. THAF38 TaxID=2587856 RepID=UPI00126934D8|nr:DUF6326 family protein [Microbulbifer sp. THAF38]QFT56744.1 hypothetical protein FIU95_19520 [Microbulbifer sp. THAF38]